MELAITRTIRNDIKEKRREGKKLNKIETAKRLLKRNYKIEEIEYITQLDKKEINKIKKKCRERKNGANRNKKNNK